MTILWLRHGETALNATRVVQPADTPLSPRGWAQARAAAARIAAMRPAAILASDLPRALQTAEVLAERTGLPVVTDDRLHERNFGALRGRAWSTLPCAPSVLQEAPEGGESMATFHARAARAWALAVQRRAEVDGLLVVVTHGLLIRAVLARHAHWPGDEIRLPPQMSNTSVSIVDAEPPHTVRLADCTAHLDAQGGPSDVAAA